MKFMMYIHKRTFTFHNPSAVYKKKKIEPSYRQFLMNDW